MILGSLFVMMSSVSLCGGVSSDPVERQEQAQAYVVAQFPAAQVKDASFLDECDSLDSPSSGLRVAGPGDPVSGLVTGHGWNAVDDPDETVLSSAWIEFKGDYLLVSSSTEDPSWIDVLPATRQNLVDWTGVRP